ncbi:ATP-binding protein [Caulobacter sp. NIBR1757]|uniref:ATP-binding protein n=1 Tax=Caulobacter sp. NIBR1757 TaxID=3016000 RepID=UPI0022F1305E|nr:ATP-binding protein [Caulobacter sp. NIBR1757]WGM37267.1 Sensor histidine kinase RcsC [Caulobacter sp. NIBR1757]
MRDTEGGIAAAGRPARAMADVYRPVVRGYVLAAAIYYAVISVSHPFYETGSTLVALEGLSFAASASGFYFWWTLGRKTVQSRWLLELAALGVNALFMANVVAYQMAHFEAPKLVYFVLMALVFATSAPSLRVAYSSSAAAIVGLVIMAQRAPHDFAGQYVFIGVAAAFAAVGIATLMRGAIRRELQARLASEALNRDLEIKLAEIERLRAEAQALATRAQAADRAKSEFLATMSHEIRTPLNGVLGMVEVMDRSPLPPRQRERLTIVRSSARSLLQLINAVLDISKIESGKMELSPSVFSLANLTDGLGRLYGGIAAEKGLSLTLVRDPDLADSRFGDEVRLRQIISNLISNALKFTDEGAITVEVGGDQTVLRVRVSDTGMGIPEDLREHIFERFAQADSSSTRRSEGSGLGLAICSELAHLMGGEIRLLPADGPKGSRFEFQLSMPAAAEAADPVDAAPDETVADAQSLRILIVDDNATNRMVLSALLGELGISASAACDGVEAVDAFVAEPWDIILMDIHMPNMDGMRACRAIRDLEAAEGRDRTPIIAVTASALTHETERYRAAGMDGCLPKPIEIERLITELQLALTPINRSVAA